MRKGRSLASLVLTASLLGATEPPAATGPFEVHGPLAGVRLVEVAAGLGPVTSITNAGGERLFFTEKTGAVCILAEGQVRTEPFLDLSALVSLESERGLLGLAFHPRYRENGWFFVDYTDLEGSIVLARYRVSAADPDRADPASAKVLLRIPKTTFAHNGGQLQFGPDSYLYVSVGDNAGRTPPETCVGLLSDSLLGKILRLDVDGSPDAPPYYSVPETNPYFGSATFRPEIWALGLRNPWRFSFDRTTGDLWIADVGQADFEEIDFEPAGSPGGRNYGWKAMEGTACFNTNGCPVEVPPCGSPLLTLPVLEYSQAGGCAVTGGYVYRGNALPQLHGHYVFGDFCLGKVWAAERKGEGFRVRLADERAPLLTTFGEAADGEIYLGTLDGRLLHLAGLAPVDTAAVFNASESRFFFRHLHLAGPADRALKFGVPGGVLPLAGDWDGDGRDSIGFYDPATGRFQLKQTLDRGPAEISFVLQGKPGAVPLAGDWDGDGKDGVGFFHPATATFELRNLLAAGKFDVTLRFGTGGGALPLAGDWDGDGKDGIGLWDPSTSTFSLKNRLQGNRADVTFQYGPRPSTWLPLAGDWDGDGRDSIGFYDPAGSVFRLKNDLAGGGTADYLFRFGAIDGGLTPLTGEW